MKSLSWYVTVLTALSFAAFVQTSYTSRTVADFRPPTRLVEPANPLLIDNRPLNHQFFSTVSRGLLTVTSANPASEQGARIPFRIYLKRNGEVVPNMAHHEDEPVTEIQLNAVLAIARPGDWLVIEPLRKEDGVARQTVLLTSPLYPLLYFSAKEGC